MIEHKSNINDDIYNYMVDDIQREVLRARNKMEDVVKHLNMHPTPARFKFAKAQELCEMLRTFTVELDELPYFETELTKANEADDE